MRWLLHASYSAPWERSSLHWNSITSPIATVSPAWTPSRRRRSTTPAASNTLSRGAKRRMSEQLEARSGCPAAMSGHFMPSASPLEAQEALEVFESGHLCESLQGLSPDYEAGPAGAPLGALDAVIVHAAAVSRDARNVLHAPLLALLGKAVEQAAHLPNCREGQRSAGREFLPTVWVRTGQGDRHRSAALMCRLELQTNIASLLSSQQALRPAAHIPGASPNSTTPCPVAADTATGFGSPSPSKCSQTRS